MARFYSRKDMQRILEQLGIRAVNDALTTQEATKVLTWRAKEEHEVEYTYNDAAIRSRVHSGSLSPVGGKNPKSRHNTYKVEDVFSLPIYPTRGIGQRKGTSEAA